MPPGARVVGGIIISALPGGAQFGIPLALSGASDLVAGDGGITFTGFTHRQQRMLIRSRPAVGAPVPVVYGVARLGVIPADYRVDTASTDDKDLFQW
jgi:hypothetical protein